ncbi:ABC transporter ATP-binding protein [Haliangium ochraceum]|uniref:ABC transporter related protein n=1 Tax=Haliangium ochraceum (strain DSM 14365 / JCM 11303 / SMP-2) TaxID=502025 RepID=D0LRS7_HALO1|nr:ABC transporter ATP-binding protein [Haliangium ochraceum]ACY19069.1 ABC transporter related protein [Haliangium ochraceum DSM 14365]
MSEAVSEAAITLRRASVSYGGPDVVRAVDLRVERGEIHVLLGQSGSGKTTLLRAIAGFEALSGGELQLFGETVDGAGKRPVPPERRQVGVVFQDYALFPHLDVGENLAFGMRARDPGRIDELLAAVGLEGYGRRPVSALSGGEQQRVALARALAQSPRMILFDEPFSNLNPSLRRSLRRQTVEILRERAITAVFVTHDRDEAFAIATKLSVMARGALLQSGTPHALYAAPRDLEVASALGDCSIVAVTDTGAGAGARCDSALGALTTTGTGDAVLVRPEQLAIEDDAAAPECVPAMVERVEYCGDCDRVELRAGDALLVARAPAGSCALGARVGVALRVRELPRVNAQRGA